MLNPKVLRAFSAEEDTQYTKQLKQIIQYSLLRM